MWRIHSASTWMPVKDYDFTSVVCHHFVLIMGDLQSVTSRRIGVVNWDDFKSLPKSKKQSRLAPKPPQRYFRRMLEHQKMIPSYVPSVVVEFRWCNTMQSVLYHVCVDVYTFFGGYHSYRGLNG